MLPPMTPDDGFGYDDRPDRRRQKKSNTSTILLVVAGVLVLVGAILIGKWMFTGNGVGNGSTEVPNLVGQTLKDARQLATNADLKVGTVTRKPCDDQSKGSVCSQDPLPKSSVDKGTAINVVVSTGAPKVTVPDVRGVQFDRAKSQLEDKGFKVEQKTQESDQTPGVVTAQDPDGGVDKEKGSTITLTVAVAPATTTVPDVTSAANCDAAKQQMQASNLTINCVEVDVTDPNQVGKVVKIDPGAGQTVRKGSTVTVQFGKAAQQVQVPNNILGQKLKDVEQALQQAGLQVGNVAGSQDPNATVVQSNPTPGSQVPQNTPVSLVTQDQGNGNGNGGFLGGNFG